MKKRIWKGSVAVVLAVIGLISFSCSDEKTAKKEKPTGHERMIEQYEANMEELKKVVVARVNGISITKYDLFTRANKLTLNYEKSGQLMTPEIKQKLQKEAFDMLIFRELAIQEAIRQKMVVPQQDIEAMLQEYKLKIGQGKDYEAYLKSKNITEASIIKLIEREKLFRMITAREISEKVKEEGAERERAVEKRKQQWVTEMKKKARIEIILSEVEKKSGDEARKQTQ